jgi:acyl-CoA synthetase (AMP-forming)/AMP-acid ligase II
LTSCDGSTRRPSDFVCFDEYTRDLQQTHSRRCRRCHDQDGGGGLYAGPDLNLRSVGRPLPGVEVVIVDAECGPQAAEAPVGAVGEVLLGGAQVGRVGLPLERQGWGQGGTPNPPVALPERLHSVRRRAGRSSRLPRPPPGTSGLGSGRHPYPTRCPNPDAYPQVGLGYHGLPTLTEERFVTRGGGRFYRTGDLGRWLPGGELELHGRADDQVKVCVPPPLHV